MAIRGKRIGKSEARFRSLANLSSDWYWEQDDRFRLTFMSSRLSEKTGLDINAYIGQRRWDRPALNLTEADWKRHRAQLERHEPFRDFEMQREGPGGRSVWLSISGEPVFDARGRFKGYRGVGRDITERKQADEDLRRFRLAMDSSADMIALIDRATMRYVDVNSTICRLLGYSRRELLAMGPADLVVPASRAELERAYDALIADPSMSSGVNSSYRCKDGSLLPFESARKVHRSGNTWIIVAISRDIRERIAAERALRESEMHFRSLIELSSDWYWEQDAELRFVATGGATDARGGITPEAHIGKQRWELPQTDIIGQTWEQHKAVLAARQPFHNLVLRRIDVNKQPRYVNVTGMPIFDAQGSFRGYRGVASDVTERVRTEEALRDSEARFRSLTQMSSDFFWETDDHNKFTQLVHGPNYVTKFGSIVIGKAAWELPSTMPDEAGWARLRATFEAREPIHEFEFGRPHADGSVRYFSVSGEPRFGVEGRYLGYRGVGRDITEIVLAREHIASLAYSDPLTGLANRTSLVPALQQAVERARRRSARLAAMFIDLDGFKQINDVHGHQTGDRFLVEVARRLRASLRASDLVARLGGDEFFVVLEDTQDIGPLETVARKLLSEILRPFELGAGRVASVSASIGISVFPADAADAAALMKNADLAMYQAKQAGKNSFSFLGGGEPSYERGTSSVS